MRQEGRRKASRFMFFTLDREHTPHKFFRQFFDFTRRNSLAQHSLPLRCICGRCASVAFDRSQQDRSGTQLLTLWCHPSWSDLPRGARARAARAFKGANSDLTQDTMPSSWKWPAEAMESQLPATVEVMPCRVHRGNDDDPIRNSSTARAHCRPSRMAQTTRDWPRRMSPAANTFGCVVA